MKHSQQLPQVQQLAEIFQKALIGVNHPQEILQVVTHSRIVQGDVVSVNHSQQNLQVTHLQKKVAQEKLRTKDMSETLIG